MTNIRYFFILSAIMHLFTFDLAIATEFNLQVEVGGVSDLNEQPQARISIYIETEEGSELIESEFMRGWDRHRVFRQNFSNLRLGEQSNGGWVFVDLYDGSNIRIRRTGLIAFSTKDITSTGWITINTRAREDSDRVFQNSYPISLPRRRNLFDDSNSRFLLQSFRHLINNDFVDNDEHWKTLHNFFLVNTDFFRDGGTTSTVNILRFLEDYYNSNREDKDYIDFYFEILTRIIMLDVSGRDFGTTIPATISNVFSNDPFLALEAGSRSLNNLFEIRKVNACFDISSRLLSVLAHSNTLYSESISDGHIRDKTYEEVYFKRIIKSFIDCSQLKYVLESDTRSGASLIDLEGGVNFLYNAGGQTRSSLTNFSCIISKASYLFPATDDDMNVWKQIYDYSDLMEDTPIANGQCTTI